MEKLRAYNAYFCGVSACVTDQLHDFSVWMVISACLDMTSPLTDPQQHQSTEIFLLYITPLVFCFGFEDRQLNGKSCKG